MSHKPVQCHIQMFFWAYCFLEGLESLVIYTQKPAMDLAEGPKIFMFIAFREGYLKRILFLNICRLFHLVFM